MTTTPSIYQASVQLTGVTGLVLDNIDTADPDNPLAQEIKKITDKSVMTAEDRQRKDWLAYLGALYLDDGKRLVLPYRCVKRALRTGAFYIGKSTLSGKIDAGVSAATTEFPVSSDAPADLEAMYADQRFRLRAMVNKNPTGKKAMVPSVRPILPSWSISMALTVFNEIIGWDDLIRAFTTTGTSVGVGNARKLGYGRFTAELSR